jgi:hypothetical protein
MVTAAGIAAAGTRVGIMACRVGADTALMREETAVRV